MILPVNPTAWSSYNVDRTAAELGELPTYSKDQGACWGLGLPCEVIKRHKGYPIVAFLLLVAMPGAPSSVLAPSGKARSP